MRAPPELLQLLGNRFLNKERKATYARSAGAGKFMIANESLVEFLEEL